MDDLTVRLTGIKLKNFKNVKYGELDFHNRRKDYRASILGLYGQNGSGKTALIDALQLLKNLLSGNAVPENLEESINVEADHAELEFSFDINFDNKFISGKYQIFYEFKLKKELDRESSDWDEISGTEPEERIAVYDEVFSYSYETKGQKIRKSPLIDTRTSSVFIPVAKYECLIGKDKEEMMDLLVAKRMAYMTSRSFVFSNELLKLITRKYEMLRENDNSDTRFFQHCIPLINMSVYGKSELFVLNTPNSGMISMNELPLSFKYNEENNITVGRMMLPLDKPAVIQSESVEVVQKVIKDMNIVLQQIVPGLTISLKDMGTQLLDNGKIGSRIQLMSCKNKKEIPLKNESDGIKKIISILQLLIVVYNHSSITVAIDELDSGIFEYLLGEILRIISERGKGQLIFTSHNLRPLETIDRGFIAFTTTNPQKRYTRMTKVKDNNNLRDFYFRDIVLGEQNEELYESTNNAEIAFAFREAGEVSGT